MAEQEEEKKKSAAESTTASSAKQTEEAKTEEVKTEELAPTAVMKRPDTPVLGKEGVEDPISNEVVYYHIE